MAIRDRFGLPLCLSVSLPSANLSSRLRALMRSVPASLLVLAVAALLPVRGADAGLPRHVPGELLIKLRDDAAPAAKRSLFDALGVVEERPLPGIGASHVTVQAADVTPLIERFAGDSRIEFIEPNYIYTLAAVPNDPEFGAQWSLRNTGQAGGTPGADIDAVAAWDVTTGSDEVIVAILDTGIDAAHPDLAPNLYTNPGEIAGNALDDDRNGFIDDVHGWDFGGADADPADTYGHGTEMAGVIGAVGDDSTGVAGIAWSVRLLPVKIADASGTTSANLTVLGIDYGVTMGARILNYSWSSGPSSEAMRLAIERARDAGVLFVIGAGNVGLDNDAVPSFPVCYDLENIVAVASTNNRDELSNFSCYGATSVDLAAPGEAIRTTLHGGRYVSDSGTSLATPHVSGVLALLWSRSPGLSAARAKEQLLASAERIPSLAGRMLTGGRLDAAAALQLPDPTPPSAVHDLTAHLIEGTTIRLEWTSPGDDGDMGTAASYDVRYATWPIDASNFRDAARAPGEPAPASAGAPQTMQLVLPAYVTRYYVTLRTGDEWGNVSPLSNVAEVTTGASPEIDVDVTSIEASLFAGQSAAETLTIANTGSGSLDFVLEIARPELGMLLGAGPEPLRESALQVLILYSGVSPSTLTPIRSALLAFPAIQRVDLRDAALTPSIEDLSAYDAIVVCGGTLPSSRILFGNLLSYFVQYGGGLVLTLDSFVDPGIEGRLAFVSPVAMALLEEGSATLGAVDRAHPILDGVGTLAGSDLADIQPAQHADVPARWSDGEPLVLTRGSGIVALNVRYFTADGTAGDAPELLRNAIVWACRPAAWLDAAPDSGRVAPGEERTIALQFATRGQIPGRHTTLLTVVSNDPDERAVTIPVALEVVPAADIDTDLTPIEFASVTVGETATKVLVVENRGAADLELTARLVNAPGVSASPAEAILPAYATLFGTLTFRPQFAGPVDGTLVLETNDPDEGTLTIRVTALGTAPPGLSVAPAALAPYVHPGDARRDTLLLVNDGAARVGWAAHVAGPAPPPALTGFTVLWDGAHGELDFGAPAGSVLAALRERGATVVMNATPVTSASLSQANAFWIRDHTQNWNLDELEALERWVGAGGSLLLEGDDEFSIPGFNYMLEMMGVEFQFGGSMTRSTVAIAPHPATEDVSSIHFLSPSFSLSGVEAPVAPLVTLGEFVAAAACMHGEGRIVAVADRVFADAAADSADNIAFARSVLDWFAAPRWIRHDPASGDLAEGTATDLAVTCDAAALPAGSYAARLFVVPANRAVPVSIVPVTLLVEIGPQLGVSTAALSFEACAGERDTLAVTVRNDGTRTLEVTGASVPDETISVHPVAFAVPPEDSASVAVVFAPHEPGAWDRPLRFLSNDWDGAPEVQIVAAGTSCDEQPAALALALASPNPFAGGTTIDFDLPSDSDVTLAVFDAAGRHVATLVRGVVPAGHHTAAWNGRDASGRRTASGVYHCRLDAGGRSLVRRLVLLR